MKIRSLVLGSVAAAGLSTAGYAADLGVLTSLDVCDSLGLSGLTISSDTNCLQISGGVEYEFRWGDYAPGTLLVGTSEDGLALGGDGLFNVPNNGATGLLDNDWHSKVKAWVKFVGTAASDFGPASAVIKLQQKQYAIITNETRGTADGSGNAGVVLDEAYVSVGDSTVIMAGKKGSIMKFGEDEPLNFLGLFNSENVDKGVKWGSSRAIGDGGHVIQIATDLGNGVSLAGGLENLNAGGTAAGTAFGVVSYAGDGIAAHLTVAAAGVLDANVESWGFHAGVAGTFDIIKVVAALAGDNTGYWNGLLSASATFDIFTLAVSGEAANTTAGTDYGFGVSGSAAVTDTVSINLGGRWYHDAGGGANGNAGAAVDAYQIAAQLVAAVTETITLTGEVGLYDTTIAASEADTYYGAATVAWAPGGGFTTSLKGEAYSNGAYRATFKAAKSFQ